MGSWMSKPSPRSNTSEHPPPSRPERSASDLNAGSSSNGHSNAQINPSEADLSSYEAASRSDPDLQSFDSTLHRRTTRAINSISIGLQTSSLSLDSFRVVIESLLETNQEAAMIILKNEIDIRKDKELADLVDDYFDNSLLTLDFCRALEECLRRAGHIESIINVALRVFEEEHHAVPEGSVRSYSRTLEELSNFRAAEAPFSQEFVKVFSSVRAKQISMLEKLQGKKRKLDSKLGTLKVWKRVSYVIFVTTFASVLICSVLAVALHASPVVAAVAAAAAVPLGSVGRWLNSLWKKCERELKGQKEIITAMEFGNLIIISDLDNIRVLVDKFQIEIDALLVNANFAAGEQDAVVISMEEIRKKVDDFVKIIHDLTEQANKCTQETRMARTLILRKMINRTSSQETGMFS